MQLNIMTQTLLQYCCPNEHSIIPPACIFILPEIQFLTNNVKRETLVL